ncbi:MAG TPA: hypothetical protein VF337_03135 [Candidatus Limnocylindrales bacterium]
MSRGPVGPVAATAVALLIVVAVVVEVVSGGSPAPASTTSPGVAAGSPAGSPSAKSTVSTPSPAPTASPMPQLVNVLLRPEEWFDQHRPTPVQSDGWLAEKGAGLVALVGGQFTVLPAGSDPFVNPSTGLRVPEKTLLDVSWTRWIIEVPGSGYDEMGNYFSNRSYWQFCGNGAMTVTLWYWQQLVGHPNVTGTKGYFLDPYASEGVAWPSPGPQIAVLNGTRMGTYWSGSDTVSGFEAHGRGFEFYLAMKAQPPTWTATGYSLWALDGKPLYPSFGTPPANTIAGLNWEISGYNAAANWAETYYAKVDKTDPTLASDLATAVALNVGRDGVPVIAMADTFNLPNWQNGSATPHTRHSVSIVGYDNAANPPTFTYTETCGRACNKRGGNKDGDIHVIPQADMVKAIQNTSGLGFAW